MCTHEMNEKCEWFIFSCIIVKENQFPLQHVQESKFTKQSIIRLIICELGM